MDDDEWQPPTQEELKLIEARRARSDQISKLMAGYLLKGCKMLGVECTICGTILLQDRSNTKHCVACEELECDTEKDNPALRAPEYTKQAPTVKQEVQASPAAAVAVSTASAPAHTTTATSPRPAGTPRGAVAAAAVEGDYLSMSSIDVHCWPASVADFGAGGDQAAAAPIMPAKPGFEPAMPAVKPDCEPRVAGPTPAIQDVGSCISILQRKIISASQTLEQTSNVDSSIELCSLISAAAEAIVAVRKASL